MTGAYFSVAVICISPPICNTTTRRKKKSILALEICAFIINKKRKLIEYFNHVIDEA